MKRWLLLGAFLLLTQFGRELLAGFLLFVVPAAIVTVTLGIAYLLGDLMERIFNFVKRENQNARTEKQALEQTTS